MLDSITKIYADLKEKANPRKKFAFSNLKKSNTNTGLSSNLTTDMIKNSTNNASGASFFSVSTNDSFHHNSNSNCNNGEILPSPENPFKPSDLNSEDYTIKDLKDQKIHVSSEKVLGKNNLIIENISNCDLFLLHSFKACYLKNISNCKIYVGGVAGGTHITNLTDSFVYLATHQLRIHTTHNSTFSVIVMSNPIIEDCSKLVFKDLNLKFKDKEEIYEVNNF